MKTKPLLALLFSAAMAHAQPGGAADPFSPPGSAPVAGIPIQAVAQDLILRYEVFSVLPVRAAVMLRDKPSDQRFYETLVGLLASREVIQEELAIMRGRSEKRGRLQSITEYIYPTEFGPAMVTTSSAKSKDEIPLKAASPEVVVPATPTAFETRDTGLTIEIEPTVDEKHSFVELRMIAERVGLADRSKWGQGTSEVELPLFESQRLDTNILIPVEVPTFVGTLSPPPLSKITPDRVWFAFVTLKFQSQARP